MQWHTKPSVRATRHGCTNSRFGLSFLAALFLLISQGASLAIQFDVFLGYDGLIPEASWFPLVCEIKNDGPSFVGAIEATPGFVSSGHSRRLVVELPTGTLKRVVLPLFAGSRGDSVWSVRLEDERGRVKADQTNIRPRRQLASGTPLIGSLPRSPSGTPVVQQVRIQQSDRQPGVARFLTPVLPDNPLVLEGMNCFYLNSEKALEMSVSQVNAIYSWVHAGGHLVVAVEQAADVNAKPWLKELIGCDVSDLKTVRNHPELQAWIRSGGPVEVPDRSQMGPPRGGQRRTNRPRPGTPATISYDNPFATLQLDRKFEAAELQVTDAKPSDRAEVIIASEGTPLMVSVARGRGKVTTLLFSPEREPFRSWEHAPVFWARLADVPLEWYASADFVNAGNFSGDGIFGAMIDTRQVNKLPVTWLLLLLLVYLVVIGPLDQYWLKRIGKPMLTWITFPCYVVFFSLLIYFIGYKLRAGESEWNELHVVDVISSGERVQMRGRTYASVYAPSNQRYSLDSPQRYATLRGEFAAAFGGNTMDKGSVTQVGDSFKADVYVPVWTSQLLVSDWWQPSNGPFRAALSRNGDGWDIDVDNDSGRKLTQAMLAAGDQIYTLGDLPPGKSRFNVGPSSGKSLVNFAQQFGSQFQFVVQSRRSAFGGGTPGHLDDLANSSIAASMLSQLPVANAYMNRFVAPPGLDISPTLRNGSAVVFAWDHGYAPVKPLSKANARRSSQNTLWRVTLN